MCRYVQDCPGKMANVLLHAHWATKDFRNLIQGDNDTLIRNDRN